MAEQKYSRKKAHSAFTVTDLRLATPALLAVATPLLGLFFWQLASFGGPATNSRVDSSPYSLQPRASARGVERSFDRALPLVPNPAFEGFRTASQPDPLRQEIRQAMISAQVDPFLFAYLSGSDRGELVSRRRRNGVQTFGLPLAFFLRRYASPIEVLRRLGNGPAGSFGRFFDNVLAESAAGLLIPADDASRLEENPFLRALESLNERTQSEPRPREDSGNAGKRPPGAQERHESPSDVSHGAEPAPNPSVGSTAPLDPSFLILNVEENGTLRYSPARRAREGGFQLADSTYRELQILPMTDPAEFPTALAVADFNHDTRADLVLHVPQQGLLRFFYQNLNGTFDEGVQVPTGRSPTSLAAADFNRDGWTDLAVSSPGAGLVTVLYGDAQAAYRHFRTFSFDIYRDYIAAADTSGFGSVELIGMTFRNQGAVLLDFVVPDGIASNRQFEYSPALDVDLPQRSGQAARVQAVMVRSSLAVSLNNRMNQLIHVLNVAAGARVYTIVGDFDSNGSIDIGVAPLR